MQNIITCMIIVCSLLSISVWGDFLSLVERRSSQAFGVSSTALWVSGVETTASCCVTDIDPCDEAVVFTEDRETAGSAMLAVSSSGTSLLGPLLSWGFR